MNNEGGFEFISDSEILRIYLVDLLTAYNSEYKV